MTEVYLLRCPVSWCRVTPSPLFHASAAISWHVAVNEDFFPKESRVLTFNLFLISSNPTEFSKVVVGFSSLSSCVITRCVSRITLQPGMEASQKT